MEHVQILDTIKNPGPKPEEPGDDPGHESGGARSKWLAKRHTMANWLRASRRFQLAEKAKIINQTMLIRFTHSTNPMRK
jgi:hypothetical protein